MFYTVYILYKFPSTINEFFPHCVMFFSDPSVFNVTRIGGLKKKYLKCLY